MCLRSSQQKEAGVSFQAPNRTLLSTPSHLRSILLPARSPTQCPEAASQVCKRVLNSHPVRGPSAIFLVVPVSPVSQSHQGIKMKAGDVGEEDRESGQNSSEGDKIQISLCDVSSEDFKKNLANTKRAP